MIEIRGRITYTDGREADYVATQREFAAWERYAIRNGLPAGNDNPMAGGSAPITMSRYLAYAAVMRGDQDPQSFEVFDSGVAEVTAEETPESLDPTPPARSIDSSR